MLSGPHEMDEEGTVFHDVRCSGHGERCYIKTGTKDGPSRGISFYICPVGSAPCKFSQVLKTPATMCPTHNSLVELQSLQSNTSNGETRRLFRCRNRGSRPWCGSYPAKIIPSQDAMSGREAAVAAPRDGTSLARESASAAGVAYSQQESRSTEQLKKQPREHREKQSPEQQQQQQQQQQARTAGHRSFVPQPSGGRGGHSGSTSSSDGVVDLTECLDKSSLQCQQKESSATRHYTQQQKSHHHEHRHQQPQSQHQQQQQQQQRHQYQPHHQHQQQSYTHQSGGLPRSHSGYTSLHGRSEASDGHHGGHSNDCHSHTSSKGAEAHVSHPRTYAEHRARLHNNPVRPFAGHVLSQPPAGDGPSHASRYAASARDLAIHPAASDRRHQHASKSSYSDQNIKPGSQSATSGTTSGSTAASQQPLITAYMGPSNAKAVLNKAYAAEPCKPRNGAGVQFTAPPIATSQNLYIEGTQRLNITATNRVIREVLEVLHRQHESVPSPDVQRDDPTGLRTVQLLPHQKHGLAWLKWREEQIPRGGILADDMGLGKTLTMLSHILKCKEDGLDAKKGKKDKPQAKKRTSDDGFEDDGEDFVLKSKSPPINAEKDHPTATLIVVPASIIMQWFSETEKRFKSGKLSVHLHHGTNRTDDSELLARHDIVLTTYGVVRSESAGLAGASFKDKGEPQPSKKKDSEQGSSASFEVIDTYSGSDEEYVPPSKSGIKTAIKSTSKCTWPLFKVRWRRLVLDEAHEIRNPKTSASKSVCELDADCRWALSGTPIQNDLVDFYSLLKFLRCRPFDDQKVWKHVTGKDQRRITRLNTVVKALLLRRTKDVISLPCKEIQVHDLSLSGDEMIAYDTLAQLSRSAIAACIREEGEGADETDRGPTRPLKKGSSDSKPSSVLADSAVASYMDRAVLQRIKPFVAGDKIWCVLLVLILRLRQCCCHLGLLVENAEKDDDAELDTSLERKLADMSLVDDDNLLDGAAENERGLSPPSCFATGVPSTKITSLLEMLAKLSKESDPNRPIKSVVVSQWTSMLNIVGQHLDRLGMSYCRIDGSANLKQRHRAAEKFNTPDSDPIVMLLSLKAGGVGLNLVGGNHLFLMDVHWNPAQELQAFDRIYRIGQTRDVVVHKFLTTGTIEQRIVELQRKKLALADGVLSGSKTSAKKLSLQDLRMLFDV